MNEKVIKSQKTLTDQFTSYEWFFFVEIAHFLSHLNGVVKNLTKWNNNLALESSLEEEIQACQSCDPPEYSFLWSEIPSTPMIHLCFKSELERTSKWTTKPKEREMKR